MLRRVAALAIASLLALPACKSAGQVAAAAITVGAAVAAAAIDHAASKSCWGACRVGEMCDRSSGLCVPLDELSPVSDDDEARWYACDPEQFQCEPDEWLMCDAEGCVWYRCDEASDWCEPREGTTSPEPPVGPVAAGHER